MMRVAARGGPCFVRSVGSTRLITVGAAGVSSRFMMMMPPTTTHSIGSLDRNKRKFPSSSISHNNNNNNNNNNAATTTKMAYTTSNSRMTANFLFAVAAVVCIRPMMTMAEGRTRTQGTYDSDDTSSSSSSPVLKYSNGKLCPLYGCPLFPVDIVSNPPRDPQHNHLHAPESLQRLAEIRNKTRNELLNTSNNGEQTDLLITLETTATKDMATMTMTGYKGGPLQSQINQDRALVVGPFWIDDPTRQPQEENDAQQKSAIILGTERRLLGVLDGHATRGEVVSEYVVKELPRMLAEKLKTAFSTTAMNGPQDDEISTTKRVLHETFLELDKNAPADPSGGCTASVVLMQGDNVYIANAGDSQSLIGIYRKNSQTTLIAYISREDKPHLPDERARVEQMGGYVYVPVRGTSRVVWVDPRTGSQTGLAMSRSLGDWTFGRIGVIPDPIVDVLNIPEVVSKEMERSRVDLSDCWTVDDDGVVSRSTDNDSDECQAQSEPPQTSGEEDDVYIFAVSATDGMLDYVAKEGIAEVVAQSLFEDEAPHPATACELLVSSAAQGWERHRQGRYRDDIAIALSVLRVPPKVAKKSGADSSDSDTASTSSSSANQGDEL